MEEKLLVFVEILLLVFVEITAGHQKASQDERGDRPQIMFMNQSCLPFESFMEEVNGIVSPKAPPLLR